MENVEISITVGRTIEKYAEGVDASDPDSVPYEIVNDPITLVGQEAIDFLAKNNISMEE